VNTTIIPPEGACFPFGKGVGGWAGKPVREAANRVIKYIKTRAGDKLVIIGCGGIFNAEDVKEKLDFGASLVQLFTGLVYEGPFLIKKIKRILAE